MDKELHWGMSRAEIVEAYNKVGGIFDRLYLPGLAKLEPGVKMQELEAERDSRKLSLERSFTQFDIQSGYDALAVHSEITYRNNESALQVRLESKNRFMFLIRDKLWKIYDELPLVAEGTLGATFEEAVGKVGEALGVDGRPVAVDIAQGIDYPTVDWQDANIHLRMIDRGFEHIVGVVVEDRATLRNLATLRANKPADPFAVDPAILTLMKRGGLSDPTSAPPEVDAGVKSPKKKK